MLVSQRALVLQLPHQHVHQMRALNGDGHFLKHVVVADVRLLQPGKKPEGVKQLPMLTIQSANPTLPLSRLYHEICVICIQSVGLLSRKNQ